jgi:hypothetical protein
VPKKSDETSVEVSRAVLEALGCPGIRRGEGSEEWKQTQGSYPFTPDLVAGPLVGGGHPSDFYIDVFEPSGDQYVKPLAGNPGAAVTMLRAIVENGSFDLAELGDTGEQLLKPMNDKLAKYVGSRAGTPMFGLAMYFTMTGNQKVGPIIAALQALNTLDVAFGITHHRGARVMGLIMRGVLSPGQSCLVVPLPIEQPLSLVLYTVRKLDGVRVVMLVNDAVRKAEHPFFGHPVIAWLRERTTPDPTAKGEGEVLAAPISDPRERGRTVISVQRTPRGEGGRD